MIDIGKVRLQAAGREIMITACDVDGRPVGTGRLPIDWVQDVITDGGSIACANLYPPGEGGPCGYAASSGISVPFESGRDD